MKNKEDFIIKFGTGDKYQITLTKKIKDLFVDFGIYERWLVELKRYGDIDNQYPMDSDICKFIQESIDMDMAHLLLLRSFIWENHGGYLYWKEFYTKLREHYLANQKKNV